MNLRALEWHKDVWEPEPGRKIQYEWADISRWFQSYDIYADEIRLCRWRNSYSINAFEGDAMVCSRKGIDRKAFENDPMYFIEDVSGHFLNTYYAQYEDDDYWFEHPY